MKANKYYALRMLDKKISVIPVGVDKKPIIAWKEYTQRLPKRSEVLKWWSDNPTARIGIVTGKISNLTVIDVEAGGVSDYLPETLTVRTGGGGYHFYYQYTDKFKNAVRIKELTDIRNDGGYVVCPPSRHQSGKRYKWLNKKAPVAFPEHLFVAETLKQKQRPKSAWDDLFQGVDRGGRNDAAAKICGYLLSRTRFTDWERIAWPALVSWNALNKPPLNEKELQSVFDSIASRVEYKQEDTERDVENLESLVDEHRERIEQKKSGKFKVVPTGFGLLDTILNGGFQEGQLITLGARTTVGKTSLALSFAKNAAEQGKKVLFFSIEMGALEIFDKLYSMVTNAPLTSIMTGLIKPEVLETGYKRIRKLPIAIAELTSAKSTEVIEIVKRRLLEEEVDLIVVDYLQFLRDGMSKDANGAQRIGLITKNLKMLARMTKTAVLCAAQINRRAEERKDAKPRLHELKESGSIEEDSDVVLLLHRKTVGDQRGEASLEVAKHRQGDTGEVKLDFNLQTTEFSEK